MFHGARWLEDPLTHGSYIRWVCVCEGLRALSFRRSSKIGTHIIIFLQGCDTDSFTFSLVFYSFTCQFVYLLSIQEGITGVCARIQCLQPDGLGVYAMGDEVSIPTTSITVRVQPPLAIRHRNTSLLLTAEVCSST